MFKTRKYNPTTEKVEIWEYEWVKNKGVSRKKYVKKIGEDNDTGYATGNDLKPGNAVCWSFEGTMGNIAVDASSILGEFDEDYGNDAILPCEIIRAGKFRHGAPRWYCRTHMVYWGTNADKKALGKIDEGFDEHEIKCSNASLKFSYVKDPEVVDLKEYKEIGIWCSLPIAISSHEIERREPKIHMHARTHDNKEKQIDKDYRALICKNPDGGLFEAEEITHIQITPPAALAFLTSIVSGKASQLGCVSCTKCNFPHLDLGTFAKEPHTKHFCANCGCDSTWTRPGIISNPLKTLHDYFNPGNEFINIDRKINLDEYDTEFYEYEVWASTPAIVWKADRPQEQGIHVHVIEKATNNRVVDDTFGEVVLDGKKLDREDLLNDMFNNRLENY